MKLRVRIWLHGTRRAGAKRYRKKSKVLPCGKLATSGGDFGAWEREKEGRKSGDAG